MSGVVAEFAEELAAYREQRQQRPLTNRDQDVVPEEWDDELEEAREKADLPETKGALTTKTIGDREYYSGAKRDTRTLESGIRGKDSGSRLSGPFSLEA